MLGLNVFKLHAKLSKVVADTSVNLTAIDKNQELRLASGVEVPLEFGGGITVNPDVVKHRVLSRQIFVVLLNLLADWVPCRGEVDQGVCGSDLIEMLYYVFHAIALWHNVAFVVDGANGSVGQSKHRCLTPNHVLQHFY